MAYADYIYYATVYMGGSLTEDIFPALAVKASAYVDYVTMGRAKNAFGDAADAVKTLCVLWLRSFKTATNSMRSRRTLSAPYRAKR